jgi:Flp pilus assembly protein TadD
MFPTGDGSPAPVNTQVHARGDAPGEAAKGEALFRQENFTAAIAHFAEAVRLRPGEGTYHLNLACATWMAGQFNHAEPHFLAALSLQPNNPHVHHTVASCLARQGLTARALDHSAAALALAPDAVPYRITHGNLLHDEGQTDAAWEVIRPLVAAGRGGPRLARLFASVADRIGQEKRALATIDRELSAPNISPGDSARLHFAAAGLLDGMGRFDSAFEHARRGNSLARRNYDPAANSRIASARIEYFSRQQLQSLARATRPSSRSLLIVGMPRSGTSLVEQILASHPKVFGAGELTWLYQAAYPNERPDRPGAEPVLIRWGQLSAIGVNQLAALYLDRIDALNSTAAYVTDKMPANFQFLGEAELLLPQCRVVHCVFSVANDYSFDLSHLAQTYREYVRLMDHWKKVLDIPILDVRYEELVADPAGQTRRMLDFLNLPWDENCLNCHLNRRQVATASRDQVRKPIYTSSVGRWKNYEKHIPQLLGLVGE